MKFQRGDFRIFNKVCVKCTNVFEAASGMAKYCQSCKDSHTCKECGGKVKLIYHEFCSMSCAAKHNYKTSQKVRDVINKGRQTEKIYKRKGTLRRTPKLSTRKIIVDKRNERHILMRRAEYINWRISVFERDNFTCQCCSRKRGGELIADHILPYYFYPEHGLNIDNGVTVCKDCNKYLPTTGQYVKTDYMALLEALWNRGVDTDDFNIMKIVNFSYAAQGLRLFNKPVYYCYMHKNISEKNSSS